MNNKLDLTIGIKNYEPPVQQAATKKKIQTANFANCANYKQRNNSCN